VSVTANWTEERVNIAVVDDGPGFPPAVLNGLGEPFISDRAAARRSDPEEAGGLGLGLFISKALLERTGAELRIANRLMPHHGAVATISWPRREFDAEARALPQRIDNVHVMKPSPS
jgi:two-component system, sensor histidine kinase RegB